MSEGVITCPKCGEAFSLSLSVSLPAKYREDTYTGRISYIGEMPKTPACPQVPRGPVPTITFATILEDSAGEAHIRAHPAGGWILVHHDHPARWIKTDGTIEEIKP